jgi:hypothetical protein
MSKSTKQTLVVVVVAIVLWWLLRKQQSNADVVASSVASGKLPPVPAFGTDNIIDAADATATQPLELPSPAPATAPPAIDWSQYVGKIS